MKDMIYRADAIEAVTEDLAVVLNVTEYETRELAVHALSALPSAEAEWIPCSERLPDDDECYLVTSSGT